MSTHGFGHCEMRFDRRGLLTGGASLAMWGLLPRVASAADARDTRLLVVILRGALDGLALAAPLGDPDYERLRGAAAMPKSGTGAGLDLDGFFALNAGMPNLHALYKSREALIVHAAATPYRARSHFDGQDMLESGFAGVGAVRDGWLNRGLQQLPSADHGKTRAAAQGLSIGAVMPLVMRGAAPVVTWMPKVNSMALANSTMDRLAGLYAHRDEKLASAFAKGMMLDDTTAAASPALAAAPPPMRAFIETAETAARFMTTPGGPRIGTLSFDGWDTHANEGATSGVLSNRLAGLDAGINAFRSGMGAAWKDTVVAIVTEFGRTAATNGTEGTDHGTGTIALLLGGAVKGGRVIANWPGLAQSKLYEGRDLAPTTDLRGVLKGALKDHLGLQQDALATSVFPDSAAVAPMTGLIA